MQLSGGQWTVDLIALLSMVASAGAILVTVFIAYRIREDVITTKLIQERIDCLEKLVEHEAFVSDEIANLLYDLFDLWASLRAIVDSVQDNRPTDDMLLADVEDRLALTEKHFAELGLFSRDANRRRSAQNSLVSLYGDLRTLELFQRIERGDFGFRDDEIGEAIARLRQRIHSTLGIMIKSDSWTGRSESGSF